LHTENNHLCQVITTFTTGLTALNGLTSQVQYLTVGTSGTDFAISSVTDTHTFNLPTASATNRGALSSADWTTFNNKTSNLGTVTSVGLSSATSGVTIGSTPITTSGTITLAIATASGSQNGLLSSTDWSTFNGKQNALTNPVTGTGTTNYLPKFTGTSTIGNSIVNESSGVINIAGRLNVLSTYASDSATQSVLRDNTGVALNFGGTASGFKWLQAQDSAGASTYYPILINPYGGNLLVGTTTDAGFKLTVGTGGKIAAFRSGNDRRGLFYTDGDGTWLESDSTGNDPLLLKSPGSGGSILFYTSTTEKVRITSGGNVGIGTASPSAYLDIVAPAGVSNPTVLRTYSNQHGLGFKSVISGTYTTIETNNTSYPLVFNPSGGNVLIGTTTDSGYRFFVQAANANWTSIYDNTASSASGLLIRLVGGSQGFYYGAYDGGAYKFYINGSGVVHSTSTSIVAISDISLKTNIRDLDKGLKDILQLKPRKFDWKNGDGIDNLGFIAQEIEKVFPELVSEFKYNQFETKKALKMGDLIPSLVKAIQELKQEIDTLKN
jgi:hypothetical protein